MAKYFNDSKKFGNASITCPYCHVYAQFQWRVTENLNSKPQKYKLIVANCNSCHLDSVWIHDAQSQEDILMIPDYPSEIDAPNSDMPNDIQQIYIEAAKVIKDSPRASAALSRLAIDQLTQQFSKKSTLDQRIGDLVSKGLSTKLQQAFDIVRVIGNNAVHPGEIELNDNREMAKSLLNLLNIITENLITQPNQINEFYNSLPESQRKHVKERDSKKD